MALFHANQDFHHVDIASSTPVFNSDLSSSPILGSIAAPSSVPGTKPHFGATSQPFHPESATDIFPPLSHAPFNTPPQVAAPSFHNLGFSAAGDLLRGQPSNLSFPRGGNFKTTAAAAAAGFSDSQMQHQQHAFQMQQMQFQHQQQQHQQQQAYFQQQHHLHHQHHMRTTNSYQGHYLGGFGSAPFAFGSHFHTTSSAVDMSTNSVAHLDILEMGSTEHDDFEFFASALSRAATPPPESLLNSPDDSPASSPESAETFSSVAPTEQAHASFAVSQSPPMHNASSIYSVPLSLSHPFATRTPTPTLVVLSKTAATLGSLSAAVSRASTPTNAPAASKVSLSPVPTCAVKPASPAASASGLSAAAAPVSIPAFDAAIMNMDGISFGTHAASASEPSPAKVVVTRSSRVVRAPKIDYIPDAQAAPRQRKGKVGRPRKYPLPIIPKALQKQTPKSRSSFTTSVTTNPKNLSAVFVDSLLSPDADDSFDSPSPSPSPSPSAPSSPGAAFPASAVVKSRSSVAREQARRRETHNVSERQRRTEMKELLEGLRTIVPVAKDDPKMHTSTILLSAVDYINDLLHEEKKILKKIAKLRHQRAHSTSA